MAGYEIAYTGALGADLKGALIVYLASGSNPITAEAWPTYVPPEGYGLNTPRGTYFNELHVLGSPFVPTGEITYITTSDGYTWESVAALQRSVYPYKAVTVNGQTISPQQIAYAMATPPAGMILVDSNDKNHANVFYGQHGSHAAEARIQYFIADAWGNTYILKSVNAANSTPELVQKAVADAVLPLGWTKLTPYFFDQDVTYTPSYSGANNSIAHANEFRDSADSAWMQVTWAKNGITLDAVAEGGLPIWAGAGGGNLVGSERDDLIYGAQGNDRIKAGAGNDKVDGGAGLNHGLYSGKIAQYTITNNGNGQLTIADNVAGRDGTDTVVRVQRLDFQNMTLAFDRGAGEHAGEAHRLYGLLDRAPDAAGLGAWINALDNGAQLKDIAKAFLQSSEFIALYGANISDDSFVAQLYSHILHRTGEDTAVRSWVNALHNGKDRADLVVAFAESAELLAHQQATVNGIAYVPVAASIFE